MQALAVLFGIFVSSHHLRILHDGAIGASTVNLHQVLINDASGTDVQVTYLRVTHLSVGQTHVLARSQQFRVRIVGMERIHERSGSFKNYVAVVVLTNAPTIENHKKCFFSHLCVV